MDYVTMQLPPLPAVRTIANGDCAYLATGAKSGLALRRDGDRIVFIIAPRKLGSLRERKAAVFEYSDHGWARAWEAYNATESASAAGYLESSARERTRAEAAAELASSLAAYPAAADELAGHRTISDLGQASLVGGLEVGKMIAGQGYDLHFADDALRVIHPAGRVIASIAYDQMLALNVDGPGARQTGSRLVGGGFGLAGAAEGILLASVVNALTSRATIQTYIEVQDAVLHAVFLSTSRTPEQVRFELKPVYGRLRLRVAELGEVAPKAASAAADPKNDPGSGQSASRPLVGATRDDVVAQLERLGNLRSSGVLTQEEFEAAKGRVLGT